MGCGDAGRNQHKLNGSAGEDSTEVPGREGQFHDKLNFDDMELPAAVELVGQPMITNNDLFFFDAGLSILND